VPWDPLLVCGLSEPLRRWICCLLSNDKKITSATLSDYEKTTC